MNFSTLLSDLKSRLSIESNASNWNDTTLKRWINDANRFIGILHPWTKLQTTQKKTTTKDQAYYDIPENYVYGSLFDLKIAGNDYEYVEWRAFDDVDFDTKKTFSIHEKYYFVYPTPDNSTDEIRIGYHKRPATMSADTDTPEVQVGLHPAIVLKAASMALDRAGDHNVSTKMEQKAVNLAKRIWRREKKQYRGPKTAGSILNNFPNYSCSGNN